MLAGEKPPGMGTAARALSTNAHTLHRALLREGTSFRQVLATAKQDYALILLRQRELGIETVASNLGYA
jgi:AraC-like DNA-binding protein